MSNRAFNLPGAWAETAATTIPDPPIPNTTYRDTTFDGTDANAAWPYAKIVDSSMFNQYLYLATLILMQEQAQGILSWSPTQQYTVANGALVFGSNGKIYKSIADSLNQDPVSATTYWKVVGESASTTVEGGVKLATSAEAIAGSDALKAITPSTLAAAFVSSKTANGYVKLPGGLIIQWCTGTGQRTETAQTVTFPLTFPTACLFTHVGIKIDTYSVVGDGCFYRVGDPTTSTQVVGLNWSGGAPATNVYPLVIAVGY